MQWLFALLLFTGLNVAIARPVSYPDGVTLMQFNNLDRHSVHAHYSPTARYSLGYRGEDWREQNWRFHGVQWNYLLNRWNGKGSQANLYFKSAIGNGSSNQPDLGSETAGFVGIAFDWEDRDFFTSYEARRYSAGDIADFSIQTARIGFAPYVGDYGDLHTWLMLQVDHRPERPDATTITPLIRFFKGEFLTEFGVSDEGDLLANFVLRF